MRIFIIIYIYTHTYTYIHTHTHVVYLLIPLLWFFWLRPSVSYSSFFSIFNATRAGIFIPIFDAFKLVFLLGLDATLFLLFL